MIKPRPYAQPLDARQPLDTAALSKKLDRSLGLYHYPPVVL